jgi:2-C-methyl-D-erythritol 4-phosphate cytidylyltransferase/2-C-methyl-D-erythritol 2,4-cyclodiphosphate synthase
MVKPLSRMDKRPHCAALIVAAGHGARAGEGLPKQYRPLAGIAVLRRSIDAFADHVAIDLVQVVIGAEHRSLYEQTIAGRDLPTPIVGGDTRQESVRRGLEGLAGAEPTLVLIHDAARPLISADTISATVRALNLADGALPVLAAADTLKRVRNGRVEATVPREDIGLAQTPQGFRFAKILSAHQAARGTSVTDDAAIAEQAGLNVVAVEGSRRNLKLTTPEDFLMAEAMLGGATSLRTGQGFDVHRLAPGDHVWLCGVRVPHSQGLIGHSDADVGLHWARRRSATSDSIFRPWTSAGAARPRTCS